MRTRDLGLGRHFGSSISHAVKSVASAAKTVASVAQTAALTPAQMLVGTAAGMLPGAAGAGAGAQGAALPAAWSSTTTVSAPATSTPVATTPALPTFAPTAPTAPAAPMTPNLQNAPTAPPPGSGGGSSDDGSSDNSSDDLTAPPDMSGLGVFMMPARTVLKGTRVLGVPRARVDRPPVTRTLPRETDPAFLPGLGHGEMLPGMSGLGGMRSKRTFGNSMFGLGAPLSRFGKVENGPKPHTIPGAGSRRVPHQAAMYRLLQMPTRPDPWVFAGMGSFESMAAKAAAMDAMNAPLVAGHAAMIPGKQMGHKFVHTAIKPGRWLGGNAASTVMAGLGDALSLANQNARHLTKGPKFQRRTISPHTMGRVQPIPGAPRGGIFPGLACADADDVGPAAMGYMSHDELAADLVPSPAGSLAPVAEDHTARNLWIAGGVMFALGVLLRRHR